MAKYTLKTVPNDQDVNAFLANVEPEQKRNDANMLLGLFEKVTGEKPVLWGPSIVGFGSYHYKYASGQEGDWMLTGFSPRKQNLVVYIMPGFARYRELMDQLGKYKTGKSCLYLNKLADIDLVILEEVIKESYEYMKGKYA